MTDNQPADNGLLPVAVNRDGSVVIETTDRETSTRRQLIFRRTRDGWEFSICVPGVGTLLLTDAQVITLAYGLRQKRDS